MFAFDNFAVVVSSHMAYTVVLHCRPQTRGKYIKECACLLPSIHSFCLPTDELPVWINPENCL